MPLRSVGVGAFDRCRPSPPPPVCPSMKLSLLGTCALVSPRRSHCRQSMQLHAHTISCCNHPRYCPPTSYSHASNNFSTTSCYQLLPARRIAHPVPIAHGALHRAAHEHFLWSVLYHSCVKSVTNCAKACVWCIESVTLMRTCLYSHAMLPFAGRVVEQQRLSVALPIIASSAPSLLVSETRRGGSSLCGQRGRRCLNPRLRVPRGARFWGPSPRTQRVRGSLGGPRVRCCLGQRRAVHRA